MYKHFFKRIIDFCIAFVALSVLALPLIIVTLWLHFSNKGAGAFFFQERPGKDSKIFKIVKFKTMTDERDTDGNLLPDEMRLTKVGKFVRSTSIDELPQFWNVLIGDMALIGPRPLLPRYLPWYTEEEKHRHDVRPGITGYAQCHGRNAVTWDEKLAMDVWYANHVSLNTDLKIIFKTIKSVLKRESVEVAGVEALDTYRKRKGK
ncbi:MULTISPECIES: sugar transferase [Bacteroides]|jgi:undecaprenyl phosphate N,N'-diacetylbacillosamine 1-phosphate transferase|uniref:sugar transferase n=1 Tax=Bacteroides TaxID=816 RepID=UPI00164C8FCF|nr:MULTISPECIES: sugar transferase [Bacteroides]MBC5587513.1 sugar transferase [Bacteroides sp. NSJ-39]